MRTKLLLIVAGIISIAIQGLRAHADIVEMRNGDRYIGKVLSMSEDSIVLQSDVLGKINVPRGNVAGVSFLANVAAGKIATNVARTATAPAVVATTTTTRSVNTNADIAVALRSLGANTNFIAQIREQMLSTAGVDANRKYDEMINGLASGQLNLNDIRRQAKSSADQLRAYQRELGPEAGDALEMYLNILDNFVQRSGSEPLTAPASRKSSAP